MESFIQITKVKDEKGNDKPINMRLELGKVFRNIGIDQEISFALYDAAEVRQISLNHYRKVLNMILSNHYIIEMDDINYGIKIWIDSKSYIEWNIKYWPMKLYSMNIH